MKPLARVASDMPRSGIREFMELASRVEGVIHLEAGEPDIVTPSSIIKAGLDAALAGFTGYTPNNGLESLRRLLVEKLRVRNGLDVELSQIVVTPGSVCALASAVLATTDPGEEVLVPDPGWPNYVNMALLAGGVPVAYPLERSTGYPDFEALEGAVTSRTKTLIMNNPVNPSGAVFPREVVEDLARFAKKHDLYVVSDEIYEAIVFDGKHEPIGQFDDGRIISVFGFSKTYAMTGWRLGYAVAPSEIAELISRLQEPLVSCASSISQKAAEAALGMSDAEVAEMSDSYRRRRDIAVDILSGVDGLLTFVPQGAFYAMLDLSSVESDTYLLARNLLEAEKVATAPGETFGSGQKGLLRISFSVDSDMLAEGCRRIVRFVEGASRGA